MISSVLGESKSLTNIKDSDKANKVVGDKMSFSLQENSNISNSLHKQEDLSMEI